MIRFVFILLLSCAVPVFGETRVPQNDLEIKLSFAPLVKQTAPAVVNIYAERVVNQVNTPFQNDPFFRDFFRNFATPQQRVQNSLGSGVILSPDGIIVSNYHVVGGAQNIRVVLNDRREYSARVLLADQDSDLAILQVSGAPDLPSLELRDSDTVEVGELVLAIGNPFGVGQTVSSGIVSGLARSGVGGGSGRGYFIQTDAPINPGNSGGALVDIDGRLIGINTSILSRSGGSNGIGFATPASLVRQFVDQARQGRQMFARPWAGINGQSLSAEVAESLGITEPSGMIVLDLHPRSPFATAGLSRGDVVTHVDGLPVNGPAEMMYRLSVVGIGQSVDVNFISPNGTQTVTVPLMLAPNDPVSHAVASADDGLLPGVVMRIINPAVQAEYDLDWTMQGILVIDAGRIAPQIGLRKGDIILAVNGNALDHPSQFDDLLRQSNRTGSITVLRQGRKIQLRFRI